MPRLMTVSWSRIVRHLRGFAMPAALSSNPGHSRLVYPASIPVSMYPMHLILSLHAARCMCRTGLRVRDCGSTERLSAPTPSLYLQGKGYVCMGEMGMCLGMHLQSEGVYDYGI